MTRIRDTHLPLLAWRWNNDRYTLISDDEPVGYLMPLGEGADAVYQDYRWRFDRAGDGAFVAADAADAADHRPLARIELARQSGKVEGDIRFENGKSFHFLRNGSLLPPLTTVRDAGGWPLLQYREEMSRRGRIQIDNFPAASQAEFPLVVLFGLFLSQAALAGSAR